MGDKLNTPESGLNFFFYKRVVVELMWDLSTAPPPNHNFPRIGTFFVTDGIGLFSPRSRTVDILPFSTRASQHGAVETEVGKSIHRKGHDWYFGAHAGSTNKPTTNPGCISWLAHHLQLPQIRRHNLYGKGRITLMPWSKDF